MNEEVIYRSESITPEQSSLLKQPNSAQYPTVQELSKNKGTTNIPENPKNQQEISDDEFFGAVKSNNTQAIQSSSLADDEFFGATRANKKKSGNQENSKESNTFVENNDTDGRKETDIRRDNIPSLEAGADNSSRVDTVDATGASFSEQSGNNISDGRGDIRVFEQGLGGKHSWSDADNERDLQREVSQRLVEIAEDNGLFIPLADTKNLGEKYQGRTGESTVYIDEAAGKVYKVKNPYAKSALKKVAPQDAIYEHIVHNLLFPEAPYKFEGISKDVDGVRIVLYCIVLSQPFINNEDSPSQSQIEQAKANGTWLKAPNGQPTNLTPEQWVTVRTRRFKEWFGDWEALWKGVKNVKILQYPNSREEALAYLATLQQPFKNEDQQVDIFVSNRDARHTMQFRNIDQIRVIGGIKDIIKNAVYVYVYDAMVNDDEVETVKAVHIYYCPVFIDGTQYSARMVVKEYYQGSQVINELHLYNVMLKKRHQTNTLSQDGTPHMRSDASIHYKVSDLIHNTQELAQINFSKIVDANGEPMPVYHGTIRKGLHKFYTFDTTKPAWFAYHKDYAKRYTKERNGWYRADVYSTFLNIRESLEIPSVNYWHKEGWGKEEIERGFANTRIPFSEVEQLFKDTNAIYLWQVTNTKEFKNLAEKYGYDGISTSEGIGVYTYAAFSPNQRCI